MTSRYGGLAFNFALAILLPLNFATAQTTKTKKVYKKTVKRKVRRIKDFNKRTFPPVNIRLQTTVATNFDRKAGLDHRKVFKHALDLDTAYEMQWFTNTKLTIEPELNVAYANNESDNQSFNFENAFTAKYTPVKHSDYLFGLSQEYHNDFAFNDDQEFIHNQYYVLGASVGFEYKFDNGVGLESAIEVALEDYNTASSSTDPDEEDNLNVDLWADLTVKINDHVKLIIPVEYEKSMARTKKSKLATGANGGVNAEEQNTTYIGAGVKFSNNGFSFKPVLYFINNEDVEFGGKDYDGTKIAIDIEYDGKDFSWESEIASQKKNFKTQTISENAGDILLTETDFEFENTFTAKNFFSKNVNFQIGLNLETTTNNNNIDTINQSYDFAIKWKI
jgi:hypothetical protein